MLNIDIKFSLLIFAKLRSLRRAPELSVSGPRRSLRRAGALHRRSLSGPALSSLRRGPAPSVSGPSGLCIGPRRSLCRGHVVFLPGSLALCVGARRSLCRGPAFSVSGPGALCVRAPMLSVSGPGARPVVFLSAAAVLSLCRGSAVSRSLCQSYVSSRAIFVGP